MSVVYNQEEAKQKLEKYVYKLYILAEELEIPLQIEVYFVRNRVTKVEVQFYRSENNIFGMKLREVVDIRKFRNFIQWSILNEYMSQRPPLSCLGIHLSEYMTQRPPLGYIGMNNI